MLLVTLSLAALPLLQAPLDEPTSMLLVGGHVLAADGSGWLEGHAVLVRDGRIEAVGPEGELSGRSYEWRRDLDGHYLVPGLIDLHTHLLLHPYDETPWNDQVLRESLELRTIRGVVAARETLLAGFTTIRDLGTEGDTVRRSADHRQRLARNKSCSHITGRCSCDPASQCGVPVFTRDSNQGSCLWIYGGLVDKPIGVGRRHCPDTSCGRTPMCRQAMPNDRFR